MQVNEKGIELICEFEGCRTQAYRDAVGIWTVGYGHTSKAGPPEVGPGMEISEPQARVPLGGGQE